MRSNLAPVVKQWGAAAVAVVSTTALLITQGQQIWNVLFAKPRAAKFHVTVGYSDVSLGPESPISSGNYRVVAQVVAQITRESEGAIKNCKAMAFGYESYGSVKRSPDFFSGFADNPKPFRFDVNDTAQTNSDGYYFAVPYNDLLMDMPNSFSIVCEETESNDVEFSIQYARGIDLPNAIRTPP